MGTEIYDVFADASTKTKIAAICFVLAKMFFFLTVTSAFVSIAIAKLNLFIYAGLVFASAILCVLELMEKKKDE